MDVSDGCGGRVMVGRVPVVGVPGCFWGAGRVFVSVERVCGGWGGDNGG